MGKFKFPTAYTILFILIATGRGDDWIVPAGKYQMAMNATLGKEVRWRERMPRGRASARDYRCFTGAD